MGARDSLMLVVHDAVSGDWTVFDRGVAQESCALMQPRVLLSAFSAVECAESAVMRPVGTIVRWTTEVFVDRRMRIVSFPHGRVVAALPAVCANRGVYLNARLQVLSGAMSVALSMRVSDRYPCVRRDRIPFDFRTGDYAAVCKAV